ncbi:hypothetical protein HMN09_01350200 [Mycena chlorophos]|uniref:Phospholipase D/nuclease n=1 Tax=Mycena chlorophos TaxID=658473 RepID=A0A8H6VT26_MYCCL|nr:hypothetical protein HMN09_01350200 [Mycena chlorophos]
MSRPVRLIAKKHDESDELAFIPRSRQRDAWMHPVERMDVDVEESEEDIAPVENIVGSGQRTTTGPQSGALPLLSDRKKLEEERLERQKNPHPSNPFQATSHASIPVIQPSKNSTLAAQRFELGQLLPTLANYANPRADERDAISLAEVIGLGDGSDATLEFVILSTNHLDRAWLEPHLPSEVPVIVVNATQRQKSNAKAFRMFANQNWVQTHPAMDKTGCFHMKFMLLFYKSGRLRVVVGTGDLCPLDWGVLENAVFIQDVFPKAACASEDQSEFAAVLVSTLKAINVQPALKEIRRTHRDIPLQKISMLSTSWDWQHVRAALVPSIAGEYHGWTQIQQQGHPRLAATLDAMKLADKPHRLSMECGGSSIPFYQRSWTNEFFASASGGYEDLRSHMKRPEDERETLEYPEQVKIVYPTQRTVMESGGHGAGSLHCIRRHWAKSNAKEGVVFPRHLFHDCESKAGTMLMHTKMIVASFTKGSPAGWTYVGSHNFTPSAWGKMSGTRKSPILTINNFELGVVFPVQTSEELDALSAWERPARKYSGNDAPWISSENRDLGELNQKLYGCGSCCKYPEDDGKFSSRTTK